MEEVVNCTNKNRYNATRTLTPNLTLNPNPITNLLIVYKLDRLFADHFSIEIFHSPQMLLSSSHRQSSTGTGMIPTVTVGSQASTGNRNESRDYVTW